MSGSDPRAFCLQRRNGGLPKVIAVHLPPAHQRAADADRLAGGGHFRPCRTVQHNLLLAGQQHRLHANVIYDCDRAVLWTGSLQVLLLQVGDEADSLEALVPILAGKPLIALNFDDMEVCKLQLHM